jgi:ribosomal protein S18 acetylase RimI-like enzyme
MGDVKIRDLTEKDAEAVSFILREGFSWWFEFQRKQHRDVQWLWDRLGPDIIRENARRKSEDSKLIVAEIDGRPVGYITASSDLGPKLGEIGIVSVDPEYQRRGIGSKLMRAALDFLKSRGVRKIWTTVSSINTPAILYYIKNGFTPEGILKSHFAEGIDEICMGMFLEK